MIEATKGETVLLSCTNNNPPTLATVIRWRQGDEVLQSLNLVEEPNGDEVTYEIEAEESGQYQCEVLSRSGTLLAVNVTLTVTEGMYNLQLYSGLLHP